MSPDSITVPDFAQDMIAVTSYEDVQAVLKSANFVVFREEYDIGHLSFVENTLAAINGRKHHERRRIEAKLFSNAALKRYERETLTPLLAEFFEECRHDVDQDGSCRLDLIDAGLYLLLRVGAAIGGLDGVTNREQTDRLLGYIDAWGIGFSFEMIKGSTVEREALLAKIAVTGVDYRREFFEASLQRRLALVADFHAGALAREDLPVDVLTMLLLHREDDWTDDLLFREVALFLTASIKTTTRALCEIVDTLSAWLGKHPEDRTILADPHALQRAVGEALRLYPVVPALIRRAVDTFTLPSGQEIPAGHDVVVMHRAANRDKRVFGADADEYDPHRGLPAEGQNYGHSFAGGMHACIGRRLAAGSGDGDDQTYGTLTTLAQAFFAAGVEPDPALPAVREEDSFFEAYAKYPVRLTNLASPSSAAGSMSEAHR